MMAPYDPSAPEYRNEKDVRDEMSRVFDVCVSCRRCTDLCGVFPTLFEAVDTAIGSTAGAGGLTPAQQDRVGDGCYQCNACATVCPYTPDQHALAIDVPRLMLRADAMRAFNGQRSSLDRRAAAAVGHAELVGRLGTTVAPVANAIAGARPGSLVRRILRWATGISAQRTLPTFTRRRFSTSFRGERDSRAVDSRAVDPGDAGLVGVDGCVVLVPTCLVEFHDPQLGIDFVEALATQGVDTVVAATGCCGAPSLHAGSLDRFASVAARCVRSLAPEVRATGAPVVVLQPTCAGVLRDHVPQHVSARHLDDARLVASHVVDASEYLHGLLGGSDGRPDAAEVGLRATHHIQNASARAGADLLTSLGVDVDVVREGAGITSLWGLRASNDAVARDCGANLTERIAGTGGTVTGEDILANLAISDHADVVPSHPIRLAPRHR